MGVLLYGTRPVTPRLLFACLALVTASGCITVYQPLVSLQRPFAVDPELANFEGQNILVRCVPGDYVELPDAQQLCQQMRELYEAQSAKVETDVPRKNTGFLTTKFKPDLIVELRGRLLKRETSNFLINLLFLASASLIPTTEEIEIAQDVIIRDASGFQLAQDSLQARFVRQYGLGVWGVNALVDLIVRPKNQKITGDGYRRDFSADFYGHLSELAFHARMRSAIMHEFDQPLTVAPPASTAPVPKAKP